MPSIFRSALMLNPNSPGTIKSIQRGTITIASGNSTNTATITAVTTSKARLTLLGFTSDTATAPNARDLFPHIVLTNGTTVTATRGNNAGFGVTVSYEVVEEN